MYGHMITKFSGMGRFTYPWCSAGALRAPELHYKRLEGTTPDYINSISKTNSKIHNRSTRFLNLNFHCPIFKKNTEGGRTFSMRTIRNWNELHYKSIILYYLFPKSGHNLIDTMM